MGELRGRVAETGKLTRLVSNYLDQHSLSPSSVEFAVEDLFPRTEVEFALGDGDDDFAAHDLTLEMGVGVVFAGAIVAIAEVGACGASFSSQTS